MKHIELFAGCGGLCLGLNKAGFDLSLANELSPMAAETFSYNMLGEDLAASANYSKTLWLSSKYSKDIEFKNRLREDPREYPDPINNSDLKEDGSNLIGSLVVGNILSLNKWLDNHPVALKKIQDLRIDLVSGGPPCQSFSLAGLREKNNAKNSLPWAFASFVNLIKPRCVLLENVTGILRPFEENGKKYHAWFEVAKTFAQYGYIPLTLHVNAKFAGVAQNRPRFILIGLRADEYQRIFNTFNEYEKELFKSSDNFFNKIRNHQEVNIEDLTVHDLNKGDTNTFKLFSNSFLKSLCVKTHDFVSVKEAIGDLSDTEPTKISDYVNNINTLFSEMLAHPSAELSCNTRQTITPRVKRRYRIYQVMTQVSKETQKALHNIICGKSDTLDPISWDEVSGFLFLNEKEKLTKFKSKSKFSEYLKEHQTKKQTQRALLRDEPAPAALSIPDDGCHYSDIRTLTAREMARIQSFPDSFVFKSKLTTGGLNRRFEVPIYTQIGNAVPVLLGYALGQAISSLLDR